MIGDVVKLTRKSKREMKLDRLCQAVQRDRLALRVYRENYKAAGRLIAGADWSANAAELRRPINLISKYQEIVSRMLVNQTPRFMYSTWYRQHTRTIETAEAWVNRQCVKMNLGDTLHRAVLDALIFMGIVKTGVATPIDAERKNWGMFAGESYAEVVNPDDWVGDLRARQFEEMTYHGHRYRGAVDVANRFFKLTGDDKLSETTNTSQFNTEGDERVQMIGRGYIGSTEEDWEPRTDLWELWLPQHHMIATFRSLSSGTPGGADELLEMREYVCPEGGPYTYLAFIPVPGQLLPKGPILDMFGFDEGANIAARKLLRAVKATKTVFAYTGAASKDMERIRDASDGQTIQVERPGEVKELVFRNPNPQLFAALRAFKDLFSWQANNLDVIGGLSRQAGTARQESQMNDNAGATMAAMTRAVVKFTGIVGGKLGWGWWHDQMGVMDAYRKLETNPKDGFVQKIGPNDRKKVDWYRDLDVKVDPYSLNADSPSAKLQQMRQLVQTVMPVMQLLQQQGGGIDFKYWLQKEGEYSNNPDIPELFQLVEPVPGETDQPSAPGKPPVSERTYRHVGASEQTESGETDDLMQQLQGAGADMSINGFGE